MQAKPPKLLVVADGPRNHHPGEAEKCAATREIIKKVDWNCEVLTNYSDVNLGCKNRVSSGLDWVFENIEEAIILEDDCVPDITFFQFCEEMLESYKHDERIMCISGLNVPHKIIKTEYSYHFSLYNRIWGWATWRRAWQYFDVEMKLWPYIYHNNFLSDILKEPRAVKYWTNIFQKAYEGKIDTWDYQWTFASWLQNGLCILPSVNLVTNIGFGEEATHTINQNSSDYRINLSLEKMNFPLLHPPFVIRDTEADKWIHNFVHNPDFLTRVKNKLKIK